MRGQFRARVLFNPPLLQRIYDRFFLGGSPFLIGLALTYRVGGLELHQLAITFRYGSDTDSPTATGSPPVRCHCPRRRPLCWSLPAVTPTLHCPAFSSTVSFRYVTSHPIRSTYRETASPRGIEPPSTCFGDRRSNQLSYGLKCLVSPRPATPSLFPSAPAFEEERLPVSAIGGPAAYQAALR